MRIVTKWLRLELRVCRCIVALYLRHLRIKFDDEFEGGAVDRGGGAQPMLRWLMTGNL